MGIGSTDEMTSTWRCRLHHMAVSLAIKKNWQARIAVVEAEELIFLCWSLILHILTHFVVLKSGDLAQARQGLLEHLARFCSSGPGRLLCRPSCCAAGLASTHGCTDARIDMCMIAIRVLYFEPEGFRPCVDPWAKILHAPLDSELWAEVVFAFRTLLLVSIGLRRVSCFSLQWVSKVANCPLPGTVQERFHPLS